VSLLLNKLIKFDPDDGYLHSCKAQFTGVAYWQVETFANGKDVVASVNDAYCQWCILQTSYRFRLNSCTLQKRNAS